MSRISDYIGEMSKSVIGDADIERILGRGLPEDPALAPLASTIATLAELRNLVPVPEVQTRHVSMAANAAREAAVPQPDRRPAARVASFRLLPRMGTSLAALALVVGMTGVAVASDATAPGDPLYGIDLALENIGVGAGGAAERIAEARDLNGRGMTFEALNHLSDTFSHDNDRPAADALKTAAERVQEQEASGVVAAEIHDGVADMLDWMASNDPKNPGFGQAVAEHARALGRDDAPGQIENAGSNSSGAGNGRGGPPPGKGR